MAYVQDRLVHDADSHLMELPDCLDPFFDAKLLARFHDLPIYKKKAGRAETWARLRALHGDAPFRAEADDNILLRKNYQAMGSFIKEDRPRALDLLGFSSQLVFTTFCLNNFGLNQGKDMELAYAAA